MDQQPLIFDVDESGFESEVIDASRQTPVAVDFWAAWCAPCRALKPALEKVIASLAGKIRLAKVDTEQNQRLAGALGVRSLPTVKLFKDARVVDEFVGAYPESQLKAFFARHLDDASDARVGKAEALLKSGRSDEALALLEEALSADPDNPGLRLKLAALKLAAGAIAEAEATLGALTPEQRQSDAAKRLFALLHFYRLCQQAPPSEALTRAVARDPGDLDARLELSARQVLDEDYQGAMEQLLEVIRRNKRYREELGRKSMLLVFDILGRENPLVGRYRSLMATAMN